MHEHFALQHLVGESHWTERTRRRILQAASYSYPVLITGPTGTGKELIARAIHLHSTRADQPLIPFQCGRLPNEMTRLQLFGHAKGANPLATHAALGCFGAAQGGTLLLHDVERLDLETQDRLLATLRRKRNRREGELDDHSTEVQIIVTSTGDLREAARRGEFRLALLYSLNAISIPALPLSERRSDVAPLARYILARITFEHGQAYRPLTPAALALLEAYDWPGNVSELEQELERAVIMTAGSELDLEDFVDLFARVEASSLGDPPKQQPEDETNGFETVPHLPAVTGRWTSLAELEADHLRTTMRSAGQNPKIAARLLGLELSVLQKKLRQHRIYGAPSSTPLSDRSAG